jgi:hypothetical protein
MEHDGDEEAKILELERWALDRWGKGDPSGFLSICDPGVVYFDNMNERRIDGLPALTAYYEAVLLGVAFLALLRAEIGAACCLLAAFSWQAAPLFGRSDYDQLAASALLLGAVLFATLRARGAQPEPAREIRLP